MTGHDLSPDERQRYQRQLLLPDIGEAGQERIMAGRVLIIGLGGLGSPVAYYLASAGVGTLGLADGDVVDLSNLQRQILHQTKDVGIHKVASAREKLAALNPGVILREHRGRQDRASLPALMDAYDVVVDATDSLEAKLLINEVCVKVGKPLVHGGIFQYSGELMTVIPGRTACYACAYAHANPTPAPSAPAGPFGAVAGTIGTLQAAECLKIIAGIGELAVDRLIIVDALNLEFRTVLMKRRPDCPVCGGAS